MRMPGRARTRSDGPIASALLEGLTGVGDVVVGDENGRVVGVPVTERAERVASATSAIVRGLGHAGGSFCLGRCELVTIKGQSAACVVGHQHGTIAMVEMEARQPTGDLESRLRKPDWASGAADTVEVPPIAQKVAESLEAVGLAAPADGDSKSVVFAGDLQLFGLADLLEFLRSNRRTGVLVCRSAAGTGTVYLRQGQVVGAASPASPGVSTSFVQRGWMSDGEMQILLEDPSENVDANLARLLIERGGAAPDEVRGALLVGITAAIRELVAWVDGRFAFNPSRPTESPVPTLDLEIDVRSLLLGIFAPEPSC